MAIISPQMEFPIDETHNRLRYISKFTNFFMSEALKIQSDVKIQSLVSDHEEKERMKQAEYRMEKVIIDTIQKEFPQDSILSEEAGFSEGKGNFLWVIDPIDGSMNFVRGIPLFSISIGIEHRETPVAGFVLLPALHTVYSAIYGEGAFKNNNRILVSKTEELQHSLIVSSFPTNRKDILSELMSEITAFIASGRSIRRTGSLVLDICWIAEGVLDGLWEKGIKVWDSSAASVILKEAGGQITGFTGDRFLRGQSDIVCSNGIIHSQIIEILKKVKSGYSLN
ncbi:MAG: inositol monophosphatase [Leptospiraceae bacterium]|nr:inositol monophosphatase [Leptospiraceae bacterium]MCK6381098.1 inositol monophosphatase [Leptospiraceae bacterium]NUM40537.1 inositol monophosphatase [Leptospiraceae bacterium]